MKNENEKKILKLKNGFYFENSKEVEDGLLLSGYFKKWETNNFNGEEYSQDSYDKFIENYFVKNELNVPINLMHGWNFESLAGKIQNMKKDDVGIFIEVLISKGAVYYENIKQLLKDKVLQGFSDEGYAVDYEIKDNGNFLIKEAVLSKVSLVDLPAEATAKIEIRNATNFDGFDFNNKKDKKVVNSKMPFLK